MIITPPILYIFPQNVNFHYGNKITLIDYIILNRYFYYNMYINIYDLYELAMIYCSLLLFLDAIGENGLTLLKDSLTL